MAVTKNLSLLRLKSIQAKPFSSKAADLPSRTLEHRETLLKEASVLIESLRTEHFKSRAKTEKALREKEKAEHESIHATLKMHQMQVKLDGAQKALEAMAKDRRERAVQGAFDASEVFLQLCFLVRQARL